MSCFNVFGKGKNGQTVELTTGQFYAMALFIGISLGAIAGAILAVHLDESYKVKTEELLHDGNVTGGMYLTSEGAIWQGGSIGVGAGLFLLLAAMYRNWASISPIVKNMTHFSGCFRLFGSGDKSTNKKPLLIP